MILQRVLAVRLVHTVVLTVLAGALWLALSGRVSPGTVLFAVVAMLVAWLLGLAYERALVLEAELVDESDLRDVERDAASVWGFG